jgi:CRISPR/Cas system CSM-associated protein Csm4 (group 5 of RAMP superfamily)
MVTIYNKSNERENNKKEYVVVELRGLSTDTKPTQLEEKYVDNGSVFIEIDSGKIFFYDLENTIWKEA